METTRGAEKGGSPHPREAPGPCMLLLLSSHIGSPPTCWLGWPVLETTQAGAPQSQPHGHMVTCWPTTPKEDGKDSGDMVTCLPGSWSTCSHWSSWDLQPGTQQWQRDSHKQGAGASLPPDRQLWHLLEGVHIPPPPIMQTRHGKNPKHADSPLPLVTLPLSLMSLHSHHTLDPGSRSTRYLWTEGAKLSESHRAPSWFHPSQGPGSSAKDTHLSS